SSTSAQSSKPASPASTSAHVNHSSPSNQTPIIPMNTSTDNDPNPNLPTIAQTLKPSRRRNGKIARLPRKLRDQVNEMLSDGLPHAEIIASLGAAGERLNKDHLINWEKGGYLEWLRDRLWLDELF